MRRVALFACVSLVPMAVLGCSAGDTSSTTSTSSVAQPIYKGTADTTTNAVMALSINLGGNQGGSCSGTVVAVKGNSGYYLTAAHCVVTQDAQGNPTKTVLNPNQLFVVAGTDYAAPSAVFYPVVEVKIHPSFNTTSLLYDFAMVRFTFNGAAPPVIPAMTPAEDTLKPGSVLDVIGYGQTETNPQNSKRNRALMTISTITGNGALVVLGEEDNSSITCQGDSGGPGMFGSNAAKRVATVTSFGFSNACTIDTAGVGRVSKVHDSFIKPFIDGSAGSLSCDECSNASTVPGGKCAAQAQACQNEPDCSAFLDCANACPQDNAACFAKCQQDHSKGATVYFGIPDCICETGCPAECGGEDFCQGNACGFAVTPEGAPNCNGCVEAKCCDVDKACFDDPVCNACATSANPDASCSSNAKLTAFYGCINGSCAEECGGSTGGAKCGFTAEPACQTCFEGACCSEFSACADDALCNDCATGTKTGAECQGSALFTDTIGCLNDKCSAECGGGGNAKCGFTADPDCQTCFEGACCDAFTACNGDALCTECMTGAKTGAECQGNALFTSAIGCLNDKCSAACGGGGTGGAGGAGGSGAGGSIGTAGSGGSGTAGSGQGGSNTAGSGQGGSNAAGSGTAGSGDAGTAGSGEGGSSTAGAGGSEAAGGSETGTAGTSAGGSGGAGAGGQAGGTTAPSQGVPAATTEDSGGCGCQVPGSGSGSTPPGAALAALSALGMLFSRRRRR